MPNKKSLRSQSTRSAVLEPDTVTGAALAEGEDRRAPEDTIGRESDPPRGPLPPGAQKEDYTGGRAQTYDDDKPRSGRKNQLV